MNGKTERSWGNGRKGNDTLDGLQKTKFCNKEAKNSTAVEVHSLPQQPCSQIPLVWSSLSSPKMDRELGGPREIGLVSAEGTA